MSGNGQTSTNDKEDFFHRLHHPMMDATLLNIATIALLIGGVVMVVSATAIFSLGTYGNTWTLAVRQIIFAIVGFLAMQFVASRPPTFTRRLAVPLMLFALSTLVAVLFIGSSVNGQRNWIELVGPFRFQPSEFAKLAIVLWGAKILAAKYDKLYLRRELLLPVGLIFAAIIVLVILEGDLGTAMVMLPMMLGMFVFVGAPKRWVAYVSGLGLAGIAVLSVVEPYRVARFTSWLNPEADPQGASFQFIHGKQAMGSGGWWGVGLGASREKWGTLPEAHTDFIYAVVGEEIGLLGTMAILLLFTVIGIVGFRVALKATDPYIQLASAGITMWIITQMIVNIGAVLGVLPITGVPLPLISYGGSSLIPTLIALGTLMSFARNQHGANGAHGVYGATSQTKSAVSKNQGTNTQAVAQ